MKFGPSPFTYEFVIDSIASQGLEAFSSFSITDHIQDAVDLGFNHFEIGLDIFSTFPIPISTEDLEKLHELKTQIDISYSCHLPFLSLDLAGPNQFIRDGSVSAMVDIYNRVKGLGSDIECFVIHPIGETTTEILNFINDPQIKSFAVDMFKQNAIQSINSFIEQTGTNPQKIAVENLGFPLKPTLEIIQETQTRFCLDTAHLLGGMSGSWGICDVLSENYQLISEIHLQEYGGDNSMSDHAALGTTGQITSEFFEILNTRNFSGPIVFELQDHEIRESCKQIRNIYPNQQGLPHF
ncbi:MAG: TIM barrel protein [Promethearchaeota archaeon]